MGESLNVAVETVKNALQLDALWANITGLVKFIPAPIMELYQTHTVIFMMAVAALLLLLAFEGYKLFKMFLFAGSAVAFGVVGYWYLAPIIPEGFKTTIPNLLNPDALIGVICAILAVILCKCAYPFMLMLLGGVAGYFVGSIFVYDLLVKHFNTLEFLQLDMVKHIAGGAIAAVLALLFLLLFKHAFIIATAFGCSIGAAIAVQQAVLPGATQNIVICCVILALAVGIFAVVRQYKEEEKSMELVFY